MASAQDIKPPLTLEGLATLFRQDVDDLPGDTVTDVNWKNTDTGLLWSNQEICRYANQAVYEFCFRQPILDQDVTPAITQITVVGSTGVYALSPKILSIRRMKLVDSNGDEFILVKRTTQNMDLEFTDWDRETSPLEGAVKYYIEDTDTHQLQLYPVPELAGTIHMTVDRLPTKNMSWSLRHLDGPEIHEQHHFCLLDYMKYLAYNKRDTETEDKSLASTYLDAFDTAVGPRPSARLLRVRKQERNYPRRIRAHFF
jgi:hypothetical protein